MVNLSAQFYQFFRFPTEPTVSSKAQEVRLVDSCIHDLVAEYSPFLSLWNTFFCYSLNVAVQWLALWLYTWKQVVLLGSTYCPKTDYLGSTYCPKTDYRDAFLRGFIKDLSYICAVRNLK